MEWKERSGREEAVGRVNVERGETEKSPQGVHVLLTYCNRAGLWEISSSSSFGQASSSPALTGT